MSATIGELYFAVEFLSESLLNQKLAGYKLTEINNYLSVAGDGAS